MWRKHISKVLPAGALLVFVSLANATIVAPGGTVSASPVSVGPGATVVANTGPITLTGTAGPLTLNATYDEVVYSDPTGVCAGCLDFVIQVTDNSPASTDIIQSVTGSGFALATTDVGFNSSVNGGAALSSPIDPANITRSNTGVVSFDYRPGQISPGQQSAYLIIRTDAKQFIPGTVTVQDGVALTGAGYGVAPEPNLTYLLSVFAVGIIGIAFRRKKNAANNTEA